MNGRQDLKSSGGMKIVGGEYGMVRVSGALKVEGTLDCEEMHASGAVKVGGRPPLRRQTCGFGRGACRGQPTERQHRHLRRVGGGRIAELQGRAA